MTEKRRAAKFQPGVLPPLIFDFNVLAANVDHFQFNSSINPNVAKAGALQSQGTKGEAVALYCDPLVTLDLECSGFPEGWKT